MKSIIRTFADYDVYEYLLVISPTGDVCQKIWGCKWDMKKILNAHFAVQTGPHMTLVVFLAYKKNEQAIINRIRSIAASITPFTTELENFGCFNFSNTIYINVVTKKYVQNVINELKQARDLLKLNVGYPPRFTGNLHISVCRGMEQSQYEIGWSKYASLSFSGNFVASSMTLLKRRPNEHTCEDIGQFAFQSTPNTLTQGNLFL